jgi:hypothetical protein
MEIDFSEESIAKFDADVQASINWMDELEVGGLEDKDFPPILLERGPTAIAVYFLWQFLQRKEK